MFHRDRPYGRQLDPRFKLRLRCRRVILMGPEFRKDAVWQRGGTDDDDDDGASKVMMVLAEKNEQPCRPGRRLLKCS